MSTQTCPACNTRLPTNATMCPRCRAPLSKPATLPQNSQAGSGPARQPLPPPLQQKTATPKPLPSASGHTVVVRGQAPVKNKAMIAAMLCAVALAALSLLKSGEAVAGFAAGQTSIATEQALVESAVAEFSRQAMPPNSPDAQWVATLGQQLVQALPHTSLYQHLYQFHVIDSAEINAFALPGGAIFIHSGLINHLDRRADLVAAVLAHEIQHVELRHGLRHVYQSMSVSALTLWTFGLSSELGLTLTDSLINTRHSRQLEREADEQALALLKAASIDPAAMPEALIRLATARQGWQPPAWLSTHPNPEDRAQALQLLTNPKVHSE